MMMNIVITIAAAVRLAKDKRDAEEERGDDSDMFCSNDATPSASSHLLSTI